jgi:ribosome maturation factor RimP
MSRSADYEAKTAALLEPVVKQFNVEIYDIEYVKEGGEYILRVYIDKSDCGSGSSITIADCEAVSRALSDLLDKDDFISDSYIMEVSSPGLGRQLKKDRHLERSIGEDVEIKTYQSIVLADSKTNTEYDKKRGTKAKTKQKGKQPSGDKEITGQLKGFDREKITIENERGELDILRTDIATIRLKFDF